MSAPPDSQTPQDPSERSSSGESDSLEVDAEVVEQRRRNPLADVDSIDLGHGLVAKRVGGPSRSPGVDETRNLDEESGPRRRAEPGRRDFLQRAGSVALGTAMVAAPAAVAIRVAIAPLFRDQVGGTLVRLASLDALVPGGPPQAFKVVADKTDAWTTYRDLPLGLVYAQRKDDGELVVFSASCPHAGCAVEYRKSGDQDGHYHCPCHESSFRLDGAIENVKTSPARRGLDSLEIDQNKLAEGEVWVRFQKFKAGIAEKQPVA